MKPLYIFLILCIPIGLYAQPANDDCANAQSITISTVGSTNIAYDTTLATESVNASCDTNHTFLDVWYEFTMPVDGNIRITNADLFDYFTIYDACSGTEITCGNDNNFFYNLSVGITYTLRIANRDTFADNKSVDIIAVENSANNDCSNPEPISINTATPTTISYNTINATESIDGSCDTNHAFHDLWYEFTMPIDGNLRITNADLFDYVTIYDSCGGTEITCRNDNGFLYGLTENTTYLLRIANRTNFVDNKSLDIIAVEVAANDDCANPETFSINTTTPTTIVYNTINAKESVDASCDTNHVFHDLWYEFTMPIDGNLRITEVDLFDYVTIYESCGGPETGCRNDNGFLYNLIAGTTYTLRIANRTNFVDNKSLDIIAVEVANNDECTNAELITINTSTPTTVNYNTIEGTESVDASCDTNHVFHDLWYEFIMPVNGNISIVDADLFDYFTLYYACNGTELFCDSNNTTIPSLTSGTNYKLRVANRTNFVDVKSFDIIATAIAINDTCVEPLTLSISETELEVDFEILGASIANELGCAGTDDYGDIWYNFTMPQDGNVSIDGNTIWNKFALYDGCGATQLDCFELSGMFENLTSGSTYYLRVFRKDDDLQTLSFTSFSIAIESTLGSIRFEKEVFTIAPNPANNIVNIKGNTEITSLQLYDLLGKKVFEFYNTSTFNVNTLKTGVYLLKISTQSGEAIKRLIVD